MPLNKLSICWTGWLSKAQVRYPQWDFHGGTHFIFISPWDRNGQIPKSWTWKPVHHWTYRLLPS